MSEKKITIYVYGSLRTGEFNHSLIEDDKYLGRGLVKGFKMYSFGVYPFVVQTFNENDVIVVEGFEVSYEKYGQINGIESMAGYHLINAKIELESKEIVTGNIYAMAYTHRNYGEVPFGDWVRNKKKRYLNENWCA